MRTTTNRKLAAIVLCGLAVSLGACAGGGDEAADDDVATLGGATDDADDATGGDGGFGAAGDPARSEAFEDAMLEFAQCMRDNGVDMPDPDFSGGGGGAIRIGGDGPMSESDVQAMEDAQEACGPIMEAAREDLPPPDPEREAEMRENMLAFSECMREQGIDFPDPVFDDNGGVSISMGPADGRTGPSPDDDEFQEAAEACGGEGAGFVVGSATAASGDDG